MKNVHVVLAVAGLAVTLPLTARAQDTLPSGVTTQMMAEGEKLFKGQGICQACHGPDGKGIPNLGANLVDDKWAHGDGSYQQILATIKSGVEPGKSTTGAAMPPKGGSNLTEDQLRAVAAYVWSLSHKPSQ